MSEINQTADALFEQQTKQFLTTHYTSHPVTATAMGVHSHDDAFDNFNRFAIRDDRDAVRAYLHAIDHISLADLSQENRIDYRLARSGVQQLLMAYERLRWHETQPGAYLNTIFYGLFLLLTRQFAPHSARSLSLLGRLRAVPDALQEAKQNLKNPPHQFVLSAIEGAEAGDGIFAYTIPAFLEEIAAASLRQAIQEASEKARAAVADYARFLREEILPTAQGEFAIGKELYEYTLRVVHHMSESADDLLAIGRTAVEAAKQELAATAEQIAPGERWENVIAELKKEHPTAQGLVEAYAAEMERAREFVVEKGIVGLPERESLRVIETPAFARHLYPYAAYMPAAPFESRQEGIFWVTPIPTDTTPEEQERQLQGHSRFNLPIIALHEAYPGHHLQMSQACQHPSFVRRHFAQSNLFIEGWALYCEEMLWQEGFYTDPRIRLMQLKAALWRACRVVLDVELHTGAITFEQAVHFLVNEAKIEPAHAQKEVARYIQDPTQPMTYLLGRQALFTLRDEYQRRQGSRFNLRRFHDELLSHGSLPPTLLRDALFVMP